MKATSDQRSAYDCKPFTQPANVTQFIVNVFGVGFTDRVTSLKFCIFEPTELISTIILDRVFFPLSTLIESHTMVRSQ